MSETEMKRKKKEFYDALEEAVDILQGIEDETQKVFSLISKANEAADFGQWKFFKDKVDAIFEIRRQLYSKVRSPLEDVTYLGGNV